MQSVITRDLIPLLHEVAAKDGIDLRAHLDGEDLNLPVGVRRALLDALTTEFMNTGLKPDDEPNDRGLQLHALMADVVRPLLTK